MFLRWRTANYVARNQAILERCHRRISGTNCIQLEARVVGLKLANEDRELRFRKLERESSAMRKGLDELKRERLTFDLQAAAALYFQGAGFDDDSPLDQIR